MISIEVKDYSKFPVRLIIEKRPKWKDKEYREAYMEAAIEQGVAWQIRINRNLREMTEEDLAVHLGIESSVISELEDPTCGGHSLETLVNIAKAFDCALSVKFISYSQLALDSEKLAETEQFAAPYSMELEELYGQQENITRSGLPIGKCSINDIC